MYKERRQGLCTAISTSSDTSQLFMLAIPSKQARTHFCFTKTLAAFWGRATKGERAVPLDPCIKRLIDMLGGAATTLEDFVNHAISGCKVRTCRQSRMSHLLIQLMAGRAFRLACSVII